LQSFLKQTNFIDHFKAPPLDNNPPEPLIMSDMPDPKPSPIIVNKNMHFKYKLRDQLE